MEAIPRLPMLCFETKPFYPKNAQFGPDLLNLIRQHYQEDPNNYLDEIQQLEKLRQQATKLNRDDEGVDILKRYFCQLFFLQKRFPSLKDVSSNNEISWKDLISSSNSKKIDYRSEFATALYNIGVLHTQLGATDDRNTEDGLKMACTHFQCAAWAFQHLREITSVNTRPDFDHGYLEFLISTCLAQAQECIAEKSISDNRKPITSAKIVTQICEYYQAAKHGLARLVQEDSIFVDSGVKCPQVNLTYLKYKLAYYRSIADLFLGIQAEEDEKMGERVAYFELAAEEFHKSRQHAAEITEFPLNKGLDEAMSFIHDIVEGKLKNAVSENNFIYHEEVPPKDKLQRVKGASLVKCIAFDFNDADISGPDIFSKLISMKAHVLSSVYSEEKAKLLRSVSASVEEKESELNSFMQSFKLDYLNATEDPNALPEELIERCAACEAKPTIAQDLIGSMNKLANAHHEVEYMMKEIMALIEEEEKADEEFQIIMGTNRPPSIISTELKCEANRYQEALKRATESNESLRDAIAAHVSNIGILSLPLDELEKQLPRVSLEYSPEERCIVTELQRLVDKVDEMKNQRALLMLRLREALRNDDITDQIVLSDEDKNDFSILVAKEIAKHQEVANLIEQNLKAQANILRAITNAYAIYAPIRKIISETAHKRGVQINDLIESFDVSDDVLQKTTKGLDFYRRLEVNARKLLSRVKGTCKVQEEERLQMYAKTGKKPPSRYRPPPEPNTLRTEKPVPAQTPMSAAPKLKDYIGQGRMGKTSGETSLPYNPYYAAVATATVVPPYSPPVTHPVTDPVTSTSAYYSTVARPPPVGSENKVQPLASIEPSIDAKVHVPAATSSVAGYTGYNYGYYSSAAGTPASSYQSLPVTSVSVTTPSLGKTSYGAQNAYAAVTYPPSNIYPPPTSNSAHGYADAYNMSQLNAAAYIGYTAYPNGPTSVQPTNVSMAKNDSTGNSSYIYASSGTAYLPTRPSYSNYANESATSNVYSAGYQVPGYSTGSSFSSAVPPASHSSSANTVAYTASYGSTTITTTIASATSYTNPTISSQYPGGMGTVLSSSSYHPSTDTYPATTNPQQNPQNSGYSYSYGVTNYPGTGPVNPENSIKPQSYSTYQMTQNYGVHNVTSQYSYPTDARYVPHNNMQQQQQQQQQQLQQNISKFNSNLTNFANSPGTYSTSFYTNAGHNITPSSTVDGRNYLSTQQQHVSNVSTPVGPNESTVGAGSGVGVCAAAAGPESYYSSQYGHQQFNPQTTDDRNAEQFVSRGGGTIVSTELSDRLQAKRNSMTYMQAGDSKKGNTVSTFSNSSSAASSRSNDSAVESKEPSNVDLLADLDFNVSDVPLVPSTLAASIATKDTTEMTETFSSLSLINGNDTDKAELPSAEKTLGTVLQSNATPQRKQSHEKAPVTTSDFVEASKSEHLMANASPAEKGKFTSEAELHLPRKEEIPKPNNERQTSISDVSEGAAPSKPVDPLSSIDALWSLKKEQC